MDFDYRLLAKYLTDTLSPEEMEKVEEWRVLSIENEDIFSKLVKLRVSWKFTQYNTPEHIEKALNGLNVKIDSRRRFQIFRSVMRYAAVVLLLVSFSYVGWDYLKPDNYVTITVKQSEDVKKIKLADGSTAWLKSGSSLKIPETFTADNRKLSLQGEAFFDVAKNAQSPLYISTNYVNIKVLGTAFNVKTDEEHQNVETVLARGKVALLDKQWKAVLDMSPGEKVTYNNRKNEYATEVVDVNICTAWRLNQFVFENVTLREIVNQLSVKFNVNINLESSKLAQRKFRCVINEDESLPDILKLLKFLAPIRYRIEGDEVFIYE
ncbi:MAG: FecR family protein [Parabacteroides johnsonii]|nr:FecR family protein [Parabacteroides johnsonii]